MISYVIKEKKLITELRVQSKTHPDESLRDFYRLFLDRLDTDKDLKKLIKTITKARKDITIKHLVNLIYRAFQYIEIYEYENLELGSYGYDDWARELDKVFSSEKNKKTYIEILKNENTQTTIYQRYLGPKAVLSAIYKNKPIDILDIGCGLNMGLPGLEKNIHFNDFADNSKNNKITELIRNDINIKNGYAVDLFDPKEKKSWALACGFYPKELKNLPKVDKLCEKIWSKSKVKFHTQSIFSISKLWKSKNYPLLDIVITSTILYQFDERDIKKALSEVNKVLKEGGILIINDFVAVNGDLVWKGKWFGNKKFGYKTVVLKKENGRLGKPLEFIQWNNGRCKEANIGRDFQKVLELK